MDIISPRVAVAAALASLAVAAPAVASAPQSVSPDSPKADWTGPVGNGLNPSFFLDGTVPGQAGTCGSPDDPRTACDRTLVHVTGVFGDGSTVKFRIDGFQPASDFDLRVYTADAAGTPDSYLGSPTSTDTGDSSPLGKSDPRYTAAGDYENKVVDLSRYADYQTGVVDQYFLVEVPYFIVAQDGYDGHAVVDAQPFVAPTA